MIVKSNQQAGWGKMSEINKQSGLNKCDQGGAKTAKCVSMRVLLFHTSEYFVCFA